MTDLALLLVGLAALGWSARFALERAVQVAQHYGLTDFTIGAVVLTIGSNLPELLVSVSAGVRILGGEDLSGVVVGNAIGSCFGQIGLTMGLVGMMAYLRMPRRVVLLHGQALIGAILALFLTGLDGLVSRVEGAVLVVFFALYLVLMVSEPADDQDVVRKRIESQWRVWSGMALGLAGVLLSAELVVHSASQLASFWGVSQSFVAIVIIGVGTSVPELAIAIAAVQKSRSGMGVGNLVGSNLLDTTLPIGIAALIAPVGFDASLVWRDLPMLVALTVLMGIFFLLRRGLQRREAGVLVLAYAGYILFKIVEAG